MNLQKTINTQKYMNYKKWIIGLCILNILPALSQEYNIENIHIDGYIGNRINTCIEHRVKSQNTDHLIEPFNPDRGRRGSRPRPDSGSRSTAPTAAKRAARSTSITGPTTRFPAREPSSSHRPASRSSTRFT